MFDADATPAIDDAPHAPAARKPSDKRRFHAEALPHSSALYRRRVKEKEILEGTHRLSVEHELVHLPGKRATLDPAGMIADAGLADEVLAALQEVPVDFRTAVILSDIEGFSYKEVADIVGIPVGTVMSRLFRGRRLLQDRLYGYAVETGVLHPTLDAAREGKSTPLSLADYRQRRARSA